MTKFTINRLFTLLQTICMLTLISYTINYIPVFATRAELPQLMSQNTGERWESGEDWWAGDIGPPGQYKKIYIGLVSLSLHSILLRAQTEQATQSATQSWQWRRDKRVSYLAWVKQLLTLTMQEGHHSKG